MKKYLTFGAALALLAGCAPFPYTEAPLAINFDTSKQLKLQAAHHWQVIANDMADTLIEALGRGSTCVGPSPTCQKFEIVSATPNSVFGRAFHTQFVSRLVNKGMNVATDGPGDVTVSINAQTVRFNGRRTQYLGVGKFTMLATGLWTLHEINEEASSAAASAAAGIMADVLEWNMSEFAKGHTPRFELILTTSATRNKQYLARTTNVYYVSNGDAALYCWTPEGCDAPGTADSSTGSTRVIHLVGDCSKGPCTSPGPAACAPTAAPSLGPVACNPPVLPALGGAAR